MIVMAQTNFTNPSIIYDTEAPVSSPGLIDWKKIINPVIQVQSSDGTPIYKTGEWYTPVGQYWLIGIGAALALGIGLLVASAMRGKDK